MDDFFGYVVIFIVFCLSLVGTTTLATDTRSFSTLIEQCRTQGFIQDKTTRIICSVENNQKETSK